jgi:hypothetical protein
VAPGQGELRALIVIECRGRPALIDVAIRAFCNSILGGKLVAMRICVAGFAIL